MIDVSVIIATYNVAPYISRAIDSALTQEGVGLEVIVVDDCSSDGTWEIVSAISNSQVRPRRNRENHGPAFSRNEAITMAGGKWIAVLDGDDEFLPGHLQRCIARAEAAQADIVTDNIEVRREEDGKSFPMFATAQFKRLGTLDLAGLIDGNMLFAKEHTLGYLKPLFSSAFLRRHQLAYDPALRIGEDYFLLAEALACGAVFALEPSIGYAYRVRTGSISHRLSLADIECMQEADRKFLSKYTLEWAAAHAQRRREKSMHRAIHFTRLVDAIKQENIATALAIGFAYPRAALELRHALIARIRRL